MNFFHAFIMAIVCFLTLSRAERLRSTSMDGERSLEEMGNGDHGDHGDHGGHGGGGTRPAPFGCPQMLEEFVPAGAAETHEIVNGTCGHAGYEVDVCVGAVCERVTRGHDYNVVSDPHMCVVNATNCYKTFCKEVGGEQVVYLGHYNACCSELSAHGHEGHESVSHHAHHSCNLEPFLGQNAEATRQALQNNSDGSQKENRDALILGLAIGIPVSIALILVGASALGYLG